MQIRDSQFYVLVGVPTLVVMLGNVVNALMLWRLGRRITSAGRSHSRTGLEERIEHLR